MTILEKRDFSEVSLSNLAKLVALTYFKSNNDEIKRFEFIMLDDEKILSKVYFFQSGYLHHATFEFHNLSESWSYKPNSLRNLGEIKPL